MNAYLGVIEKFEHLTKDSIIQNVTNEIGTIGFWITTDLYSAIPYAIGTKTVYEKSDTQFWEDGEPKLIQIEKLVKGYVYKVYMNEPHLKIFDTFDLFMTDRDKYCDYFQGKKTNLTWKDEAVLLNKEEANKKFRNNLISQGYEGFLIKNFRFQNVTDLYCLFTVNSLSISDILPVDTLSNDTSI